MPPSIAGSSNIETGGAFDPSRDQALTGNVDVKGSLSVATAISAYGPSGTVGYSSGVVGGTATGGTVTQATSRSTGVTLNKICGTITTNTTSLAAEASATFVVTNSTVAIGDTVCCSQQSGSNGGNTDLVVVAVAAGSFSIMVANNNASAGTAETGAILINFAVIKSVTT